MRVAVELVSAGGAVSRDAGGMSVYYGGLIGALGRRGDAEVVVLAPPWSFGLVPGGARTRVLSAGRTPRSRVLRPVYEQSVLPRSVRATGADVLLSTCNTRPFLWRGASVVVLQSLQFLAFPAMFGRLRLQYLRRVVPASLRSADAVIAVSEWARNEAIDLFGLEPSRVFAVHHGVSTALGANATSVQRPRPYVVMVSTLYGFKNQRRLIEAFGLLVRRTAIPHDLVLAGGDADVTAADLIATARRHGVADRVELLGAVPHERVPGLVAGADAVAYVSRHETFGHPIIEALALGKPLVTSQVSAMQEVAADAARLVDPESVESIAEGLSDVLLDETLRDTLRKRGPKRAAEFTWERCAEGTLRALRAAVAHRGVAA